MTLSERLIALRGDATMAQAAANLGVAKSTYYNWETKGTAPVAATLRKIADYYGVSVKYLLGKDEPAPVPEDPENKRKLEESLMACLRDRMAREKSNTNVRLITQIAQTLINYYSLETGGCKSCQSS